MTSPPLVCLSETMNHKDHLTNLQYGIPTPTTTSELSFGTCVTRRILERYSTTLSLGSSPSAEKDKARIGATKNISTAKTITS